MNDRDFESAGLLDGLSPAERADRLALLRELGRAGISLAELKAAVAEERLALMPMEVTLGADASYTPGELAALSGLREEFVVHQRAALGLPRPAADERAFSEDNLASARAVKQLLDAGVSEEQALGLSRVAGRGVAQIADVAIELLVSVALRAGDSERALAERLGQAADMVVPRLAALIEGPLRVHLHDRVRREVVGRTERTAGRLPAAHTVTVCFADLIGFTQLGHRGTIDEVDRVVVRFGELAADVAHAPVRLIKLIGDAAMLVGPEPEGVVSAAIALIRAARDEQLPPLRAGVASGPALRRAGDFYGHTVNLASRACTAAEPYMVVADDNARDGSASRPWQPLGPVTLKGIDTPTPLYALTTDA